jgi:hypothetical protein
MSKQHPHAAVIERIGPAIVQDHFLVSRQTLWTWRTKGIDRKMLKAVALLGSTRGVDVSELGTSAESAASSAEPA